MIRYRDHGGLTEKLTTKYSSFDFLSFMLCHADVENHAIMEVEISALKLLEDIFCYCCLTLTLI